MTNENFLDDLGRFFIHEGVPVCPLTVGITGHRKMDMTFRETIREELRKYFRQLCQTWKKWNGGLEIPILVFNGMAEGADQLVAEVVAELKALPETACLKLVAVLPLPYEDYVADFDTQESLEAFEHAMRQADAVTTIPWTIENQKLRQDNPEAKIDRRAQYAALGKYLVSNSFLFLALWDGIVPENLPNFAGGTADVVRMKLTGIFPSYFSLGLKRGIAMNRKRGEVIQPTGGVYQITTPISGNTQGHLSAGATYGLLQQDVYEICSNETSFQPRRTPLSAPRFFQRKSVCNPLKLLGIANRDSCRFMKMEKVSEELKTSKQELLKDYSVEPSGNLCSLIDYYALWDCLSQKYQRYFNWLSLLYIFLGIFLGFLFYMECFFKPIGSLPKWTMEATGWSHPYPWTWERMALDGAYYTVLLLLFVIYCFYQKWRFYERYHRYRAVAEALRVQIFWHMAGIAERGMDHYRYHQVNSMNWLRLTVNVLQIPLCPQKDVESDHPGLRFIYERWILDQKVFFQNKVKSLKEKSMLWNGMGWILTILTIFWLFFRLWVARVDFEDSFTNTLFSWLSVLVAMSGVLAVGCYLFSRLRCFDALLNRYSKMLPIYRHYEEIVDKKLERSEEIDEETLEYLHQIGIHALTENADWFLIQRKLELPK